MAPSWVRIMSCCCHGIREQPSTAAQSLRGTSGADKGTLKRTKCFRQRRFRSVRLDLQPKEPLMDPAACDSCSSSSLSRISWSWHGKAGVFPLLPKVLPLRKCCWPYAKMDGNRPCWDAWSLELKCRRGRPNLWLGWCRSLTLTGVRFHLHVRFCCTQQ